MKAAPEVNDVVRAMSAALEPLIDVCLKIGVTSPEIESLLRVAFVQRAFVKLPRHSRTGRGPSDSRVGLATGVHRSEVSRIRSAGGTASAKGTMEKKKGLYSKSARVLNGWTTDPRYMTSGGLPLDLPMERNKERRSFEDLVDKYAPGNHPGSVLKELRRRGNVELLDGEVIRFKSSTTRTSGVTKANVAQAAIRIKRLGDTLFQGVLDTEQSRLYVETKTMQLNAKQLALIRAVLERRANTFLTALEGEFRARTAPEANGETKRMGVSVFSWEEDKER
jgi:Family of unknown function (DUF6502)